MDAPVNADVLIVGGGPAGSSLAVALARRGVDALVVDRARFPRPKPCAEYLSPEASRVLADMGALARVEQSGAAALSGVRVRAPNGLVIAGDFVARHGFKAYSERGLSVRREVLDEILFDCARTAGARVVEGLRITDLVRDRTNRVAGAQTADGEIHARFTIAADGLRSVVARRLGLAKTTRWPRRLALVTHYTGVGDVGEHGEMHVERDGYVGIADVGHGATTVALVVPASRAKEFAVDRGAFLDRWLASRPHLAARFAKAERVSPVVATGPFGASSRRAWAPGAALVGDAADFFDPFTGEGIYAALRGGELLADALDTALHSHDQGVAALREYDRARRREFGGKWIVERVIGAVVGSPPLINRAARRLSVRKDLADLLIGVTGNFVPASEVVRWSYVWKVFVG
jgi:flavin-dependent dehydrogenase